MNLGNDGTHLSYDTFNNVLLLGEGDFSFGRAFAMACMANETKVNITASEYGKSEEVAERYFHGDQDRLAQAMNSLLDIDPIQDVICGLNARLLGEIDYRAKKCKPIHDNDNNCLNKVSQTGVCLCHRWNVSQNQWDPESAFWIDGDKNRKIMSNIGLYDLIIFNFPHSDQAGRASKLVKALFKQLRFCIDSGRVARDMVLEMRLRTIESNPKHRKNVRSLYNHEESGNENGFVCIGCWRGDLETWKQYGYEHRMTKKNETCRDINLDCKIWRWRSI